MEARYADQDRGTFVGGTILVGILFVFVLLVVRLVRINTALSSTLEDVVLAHQTGRTPIPARRGHIVDAAGRVLAGTRQVPSVFADPSLIEDVVDVARRLGPVLHEPAGLIEQTLRENASRRFCWLARSLAPADAEAVTSMKIKGVGVRAEPERYYPTGPLFGPVLGFVGADDRGLEGVELFYDEHLRGTSGRHAAIYNGLKQRRRPIWRQAGHCAPARDGGDVVLTLDSVVQGIAARHLDRAVEEFGAQSGVAVVMVPGTGEVLALVQSPRFDPNRFQEAPAEARRNMAVCDMFEPGSVFKPYVACGALLAGVVDPAEVIDCGQGVHYFGRRRLRDTSPRGELTFAGILSKSSNIGMAILGERMGNVSIHQVVRAFGFGERTGIGFPGESPGMVRPLNQWDSYSTTSVPIGQEIAVTPLQLATAFSAIVNRGTLVRPRLVKALVEADGAVAAAHDGPEFVRQVLPEELAAYMTREVLVGVVTDGGGKPAALEEWQVLGKTGTAQIAYVRDGDERNRGYEPGAYNGSFIGAAPARDPQCVVLVTIHRPNPDIGYYGSTVAAPAVGRILAETLAYMQVPPDGV